ncbi:MAG: hypothetical protein M3Z50_12880 [Actinomycetota bacterium]|nr:hypothetical protein [Actinomycetota bacterium]
MKFGRLLGSVTTILVGAAFVVAMGLLLHQRAAPAQGNAVQIRGTASTAQGNVKHVFIQLSTYPDSMAGEHGADGGAQPGWVSYGPTTDLKVPAHSLVTVTIKQYDTGGEITNPYFARVHGTLGETETVNGKKITGFDPKAIGHTFTLHAAPTAQDPLYLSAPLPAVSDTAPPAKGSNYAKPNVVTFSFMTHGPGKYIWNCEYPCGDGYYAKFGGPMSTRGYMSGTLTVS